MSNNAPEGSKKFDINSLVGSIKSLINPTSATPDVNPDDAIGVKIAQLSVIAQQLSKSSAEQAKEWARMNQLLNGLYQDIERLRHPVGKAVSTADTMASAEEVITPVVTAVETVTKVETESVFTPVTEASDVQSANTETETVKSSKKSTRTAKIDEEKSGDI